MPGRIKEDAAVKTNNTSGLLGNRERELDFSAIFLSAWRWTDLDMSKLDMFRANPPWIHSINAGTELAKMRRYPG